MNIHFQQAEKKSQVFFYMLVALAVFTVAVLILNIGRQSELHLSVLSSSGQETLMENSSLPIAVPVPLPPAEQLEGPATPVFTSTPSPLPQAVAVPVPDMP